jgi:mRNA interferase RelE/StbE
VFALVYHPLVKQDLAALNRDIKDRLAKAIDSRLSTQPQSYGKPLRGSLSGYWTLRVGDCRVVYRIVKQEVWIFAIIHRRDVYSDVMSRLSWPTA